MFSYTLCAMNRRVDNPTTTISPQPASQDILSSVKVADAVNFINNAVTLSMCRIECSAETNDLIFTSNFINIKNCTILCTPSSPQKLVMPEPGFVFNAQNISHHFTNVQGTNLNFSITPESKTKANPTVLVDDEAYVPAIRGDN